jgi:hypothetical protein
VDGTGVDPLEEGRPRHLFLDRHPRPYRPHHEAKRTHSISRQASPSRESWCKNRYLTALRSALFVTRVVAFLELFAAFLAAGFFGETFFVATRFTSSL